MKERQMDKRKGPLQSRGVCGLWIVGRLHCDQLKQRLFLVRQYSARRLFASVTGASGDAAAALAAVGAAVRPDRGRRRRARCRVHARRRRALAAVSWALAACTLDAVHIVCRCAACSLKRELPRLQLGVSQCEQPFSPLLQLKGVLLESDFSERNFYELARRYSGCGCVRQI
eukprot:6209313-Pleurochrysis_carterae.AAC.1